MLCVFLFLSILFLMIEKGELGYMEEREYGRGSYCNREFVKWIPVSRSVEGNRAIGGAGGNRE